MVEDVPEGTQAVQRALRVLACYRSDRTRLTLTEVAAEAGLTMPTAHRIVKALRYRGYLVQDEQTRQYSLGPTVLRLAQVIMQRDTQHALIRLVLPHLERLRDATGETAILHYPMELQRMCVAEVPSRQPVRMADGLGTLYPLHRGAAGKVILAWSSATTVERVIANAAGLLDGANIERRLQRELPRIRKDGFAISMGETDAGAAAIAVPVFSSSGRIAGAIAVTGPLDRWNRRAILDHVPMLIDAGNTVSATLGYAGVSEPV